MQAGDAAGEVVGHVEKSGVGICNFDAPSEQIYWGVPGPGRNGMALP
jgi:hypothetical protein